MKYANGRPAQINDLVLCTPHGGASAPFIGKVTTLQGAAFQVVPQYCQNAQYIAPADALLLADALLPAGEIKPFTA